MLNFIAEIKTLRVRMTFDKKKKEKKCTYSDKLAYMNMQKNGVIFLSAACIYRI